MTHIWSKFLLNLDWILETLACDHTKVTPYFIESINSERGFWAGPCTTLVSYLLGWCEPKDSDYVLMGEHLSHRFNSRLFKKKNDKFLFQFLQITRSLLRNHQCQTTVRQGFPGKEPANGQELRLQWSPTEVKYWHPVIESKMVVITIRYLKITNNKQIKRRISDISNQ